MNTSTPISGLFGFGNLLAARRVTKIRMSSPSLLASYEHITDLSGDGWISSRADVVRDIANGRTYYTSEDGKVALLQIEHGSNGPYVRTHPDCSTANNLLWLPRF